MIKGIYIHIPFCNIKCPYCDFTSFVWQEDKLKDRYVEALKKSF
jgi:Coproporphyrinogen III oxidase and related Fe-S oxidoreductases